MGRPALRGVIELTQRLDIRWMRRSGYLEDGRAGRLYSYGQEVAALWYEVRDEAVVVRYRAREDDAWRDLECYRRKPG